MDGQRIDEMGRAVSSMSDVEFQRKFRMTKDEFNRQYEYVMTGTDRNAAGTWSKRSTVPDTALDTSTTRSNASEPSRGSSSNPSPTNPESQTSTGNPRKSAERLNMNRKMGYRGKIQKGSEVSDEIKQEVKDKRFDRRRNARESSISKMGRRGSIGTFGFLGAMLDGVSTYSAERAEDPNGSKAVDMAKATGVAAAWLYAPGIMWSIAGANAAITVGKELYEDANRNYQAEKKQSLHITNDASGTAKGTLGGQLIDSDTAYTMRQRNEQVMRQHKIATESILGSEARQLHR